jgi:hypothetical protein
MLGLLKECRDLKMRIELWKWNTDIDVVDIAWIFEETEVYEFGVGKYIAETTDKFCVRVFFFAFFDE